MNGGRQLGFVVDATRCVNCKACEIACQDANNAGVVRLRRVRSFEHGSFPAVVAYNISMSCNHCADPLCVKYCPAQAYTKRKADGVVLHNPDRCLGCRYCTWVCPYGAPQYDPAAGHVRKCNFCLDELDAGRDPVCVAACPVRAIEVAFVEEIRTRAGATIRTPDMPSPDFTHPACRYVLRKGVSNV